MIDLHNHSVFSMDSNTPMEDNIKTAIDKNLKYLSITDHMEIMKSTDKYWESLDAPGYFEEFNRLKDKYKDKINLLAGVEVGIQETTAAIVDDFVKEFEYDFVIGSIHCLFEKDLYAGGYYEKLKPEELYKIYYEEMYKSVKAMKNFDVLGHIDYIDRYLDNYFDVPDQDENKEVIIEILKELINSNRGIEINTGGFRKGLPYLHPHRKILSWYRELGGEIVTIGSDAHKSYDIGYKNEKAMEYLKSFGFSGVYVFENRKPRKLEF